MTDSRLSLTDRSVAELPLAASGQYRVRDSELSGFFVLVGKRRKTFMVQADLRIEGGRKSLRVNVGLFGDITTRSARATAREVLGKVGRGIDPREPAKKAAPTPPPSLEPTLREAWARYRTAHMERKGRSPGTIENYRDHVERLMSDWQDRSLADLGNDPKLVIDRHEKISESNGPYIANGCMRTLRAIYNHARKSCRSLPHENPVGALDWNREVRRDTGLGLSDLKIWFVQASALTHPLRREFHLFILLSACRPDAVKRARPQDINFRDRVLHVAKPKGGERKAFDIPLSRAMCRCLVRALRLGRMLYPDQAANWVFPADSASGHLAEHKENRKRLGSWGNELRQTYRTIGQMAGIGDLDSHLLMNHSLPGVNAGYITRAKLLSNHLRGQQERISNLMMSCAPKRGDALEWPFESSRALTEKSRQRSANQV